MVKFAASIFNRTLLDTFLTIQQTSEGLYKEKGSRFIAYAYPVETVDEVKNILLQLRKQYHDARHICYAYSIGIETPETRANDDGEPSGTAGKPIHGVILSNKINNVLIAVVRYFGGVKLGASGLINAYREAAADAISNNEVIEKTIQTAFCISFEYPFVNDVMRIMKEEECNIITQNFDLDCAIRFNIRKANADKVKTRLEKIERIKIDNC